MFYDVCVFFLHAGGVFIIIILKKVCVRKWTRVVDEVEGKLGWWATPN